MSIFAIIGLILFIGLFIFLGWKYMETMFFFFKKVDYSHVKIEKLRIPIREIEINARFLYPKSKLDQNENPIEKIPLVFVNHGWNNILQMFLHLALAFCVGGEFAVLTYDCRGHGKSGGKKRLNEVLFDDVKEIIQYGSKLTGVDKKRLGFFGLSMGGMIALTRAYKDKKIKAIVSACAPYDIKASFLSKDKPLSSRISQKLLQITTPLDLDKLSDDTNRLISPAFFIEKDNTELNERVLVMHAKNDSLVSYSQFVKICDSLNTPKSQQITFEKGNHGFSFQQYTLVG
ncbi:MAG: alpha/beta fold hydrolase, partial [Candidatus Lokiarchaeota archaeon]|nr:alpha/beta fold hydrolase [Candidatus Lokiarchaeota archaeon]